MNASMGSIYRHIRRRPSLVNCSLYSLPKPTAVPGPDYYHHPSFVCLNHNPSQIISSRSASASNFLKRISISRPLLLSYAPDYSRPGVATNGFSSYSRDDSTSPGEPKEECCEEIPDRCPNSDRVMYGVLDYPDGFDLTSADLKNSDAKFYRRFSGVNWVVSCTVQMHVTPIASVLNNVQTLRVPILMKLPNGSIIGGLHTGDVSVCRWIPLRSVVHMPDLKDSLLSISCLLETANLDVLFQHRKCIFTDKYTGDVAIARQDERGRFVLRMPRFRVKRRW